MAHPEDVINPSNLVTGSQAISGTAAEMLEAQDGARGGLVINNQSDDVAYIAMGSAADNDAFPLAANGGELALGDYRGAVWIRGDGSGRVHYAYTL